MNKYWIAAGIHLLIFIPLFIFTYVNLHNVAPSLYLGFTSIFTFAVLFSLYLVIVKRMGVFFYVISLLLFLGFPFKFSVHEILRTTYLEPTGLFKFTAFEYSELLKVSMWGIAGLILAQILGFIFLKKGQNIIQKQDVYKLNRKLFVLFLAIVIIMAGLNLRYNIILFGMTPDVILPFKGNTIFFLILTRFIPYALFFYCIKNFTYRGVIIGSIIFSIASIGVVSRMVIIVYYTTLLLVILKNASSVSVKETFKRFGFVILVVILSGYGTVSLSTRLRYVLNREMPRNTTLLVKNVDSTEGSSLKDVLSTIVVKNDPSDEVNNKSNSEKEVGTLETSKVAKQIGPELEVRGEGVVEKISEAIEISSTSSTLITIGSLAVERWIGVEGLMAVVAYPHKSLSLLLDAFKEKGFKNDGKSFFNKIADLKLMKILAKEKNKKNVSTTVPGPFAFFYYSGNRALMGFAIFIFSLFIFAIEEAFNKIFLREDFCSVYTSIFMAYDFYQFGISPISFVKYWSFTFFCLGAWMVWEKRLFLNFRQRLFQA